MYREFYAINKEQKGNNSYNRWENYQLMIYRDIYNKIQDFVPINGNNSNKNNKGFRITKNKNDTGCFIKMDNQNNILHNNNTINTNNNQFSHDIDDPINNIQNTGNNNIKILPFKKKNDEDKIEEETY